MSRLFWRLFFIIWLSIAGLICMLILLTNVFGIKPPQREFEKAQQLFILNLAKDLLADGNPQLVPPLARAALAARTPIVLTVEPQAAEACRLPDAATVSNAVESAGHCYRVSAASAKQGIFDFLFLGLPFAVGALASLIAAFWLANYLVGPIDTLKDGLSALAHGNFHIRIGKAFGRRKDELSSLGLDFDSTASKLQALQQIQQRLYHDVSHELRSPLSRMQAAIGLVRQNPAKLESFLPRMTREIERLDALVDEILTLAKLNSGSGAAFERHNIDVIDLLSEIVDDAAFEGKPREVVVEMTTVQSFVCNINGELIYRALENVLRNAVKYTGAGTSVKVDAQVRETASGKTLRIVIDDEGPGVATDQLERIFEPFTRGADMTDVVGHGLGLAIARQSLEIHGGRIWADTAPGGGLRMVAEIPG